MISGGGQNVRHHFSKVVTEKLSLTTGPYQRGGHFFRHVRTACLFMTRFPIRRAKRTSDLHNYF